MKADIVLMLVGACHAQMWFYLDIDIQSTQRFKSTLICAKYLQMQLIVHNKS